MTAHEVGSPIINAPFEEPAQHWVFERGAYARQEPGRRGAGYWRKDTGSNEDGESQYVELRIANLLRERVAEWRDAEYPGVTSVTRDLLRWWTREDREWPLFFAQREAAETVIFLLEARADLKVGVDVPLEIEQAAEDGYRGFLRYALKMATGSGKTTVMAMLAAWSILNKVHDPRSAVHSDTVLVVCPTVTIRSRLQELKPERGKDSLYIKRDLLPPGYQTELLKGQVSVTNWHAFELATLGDGASVVKRGKPVVFTEKVTFGKPKAEGTKRKRRNDMTREEYEVRKAAGLISVVANSEKHNPKTGLLESAEIQRIRYVERDKPNVKRLAKELNLKSRRGILVFNDEAHHAYRLSIAPPRVPQDADEAEQLEHEQREATVWIEGLDRINRYLSGEKGTAGVGLVVDFSATPFYLSSVGYNEERHFPWIVSDFGLVDAIESGLVKVPQLPLDDPAGEEQAKYFNLWKYVMAQLGRGERGAGKTEPKPEAVLQHAQQALVQLARSWWDTYGEWERTRNDGKRPVLIIVCKNTKLAQLVADWIGGVTTDITPLPPELRDALANTPEQINTVRIDTKVVHDDEAALAKDSKMRWLRYTLDTVGQQDWPRDENGQPVYPEGFLETAKKLKLNTANELVPPGRSVRCIVSVGMLTEGWDCQTVTHIAGLRPFGSQLLCEQVAGRGLRRTDYIPDEATGFYTEELARIVGVPFEVVPFKATGGKPPVQRPKYRVHALNEKQQFEIRFPRVEGYYQRITQRLTVDWQHIQDLYLDPTKIPPKTRLSVQFPGNLGKRSLYGPGGKLMLDIQRERDSLREQSVVYMLGSWLCRELLDDEGGSRIRRDLVLSPGELLSQCLKLTERYVKDKVHALHPDLDKRDLYFEPYAHYVIHTLRDSLRPDPASGDSAELPRFEKMRGDGSTAEVNFMTSKLVYEAERTHLNYVVFDSTWEETHASVIDQHSVTKAFVKNDRLGFVVPYSEHGIMREYIPDFIIRVNAPDERYIVLETKGWITTNVQAKQDAAKRWCAAVNANGEHGHWQYEMVSTRTEATERLDTIAAGL